MAEVHRIWTQLPTVKAMMKPALMPLVEIASGGNYLPYLANWQSSQA
jgi:hypothetical protein